MHDQIQFHVGSTSQAAARVYFSLRSGEKILSVTGKCAGPYSKYAKTLSAEFSLQLAKHPETQKIIAETLVIDPCYWSPTLPFTYEVEFQLQIESGADLSCRATLGMRQWHGEQNSLFLGSRRTVLRGYRCLELSEETAQQAHQQESSLLIDPDDLTAYEAADRLGVGLIVDLREAGESLNDQIHSLNWSPSALVAMVDAEQIHLLSQNLLPQQCLIAQHLTADSQHSEISEIIPDVLAIELDAEQRPPEWLSLVEQPVIAIRRGVSEDQLQQPRRHCDLMQADLAPEFNLAGYFVSP